MGEIYRRRGIEQPCLVIVELDGVLGERAVRRERKDGMNGGDRKGSTAGDGERQIWASPDQEEAKIARREV